MSLLDISLQTWVVAVLLLAARLAGLLLLAPPLSAAFIPLSVRTAVVVALATCLAVVPTGATSISLSVGFLLVAFLKEVALGATMALGVSLAFGAFAVGGRLLDVQIGFGIGQVFDPLTRQQLPILSAVFNLLALVTFFSADVHQTLLRGFVLSIDAFPVGGTWPIDRGVTPLIQQSAASFSLGFAMVAPVVLCLLLVEVSLGVLARNMPQMNMFALAIPVKVIVGLGALSISIVGIASILSRVNSTIFKAWEAMFR